MNYFRSLFVTVSILGLSLGAFAQEKTGNTGVREAQPEVSERTPQTGMVYRPESGKVQTPGYARTTYVLPSADGRKPAAMSTPTLKASPSVVSPEAVVLTEIAETPQSLGCLYVANPSSAGCIPNYNSGSGGPSANGYGAIALVDAFDNPDAASDLQAFDSYWGLAPASFVKVYANGNGDCSTPATNAGWSVESSMDIEYAHVFAPNAAIILVEACTNSLTDLFYAEQVAFNYIVSNYPAGGQVSNSWLGGEFSGQISDDAFFADFNYNWADGYKTPILAFASAGDGGAGPAFPSNSPWVISAGGTSIMRNSSTLKFSSEACWGGSGGGISTIETYATSFSGGNSGPWANSQYAIFGEGPRATPDMSFNADPASGAWVYSAFGLGGWSPVGGTSLSSPALASIVNRMGNKLGSVFLTPSTSSSDYFSTWEHNYIYSQLATTKAYKANFYDVKTGSNGHKAVANWDMCTGVGSPRGGLGK
jgi:kumamolisin